MVTRYFWYRARRLRCIIFLLRLSAMALAEFYLTAYMARFEETIRESMKKTLWMVVANLG